MEENGRRAANGLRAIATAEALLRAQDLDSNRLMDYWTGDVAQLHFMAPKGKPIGLITPALAAADAKPLKPSAAPASYAGYWFVALEKDEGVEPSEQEYRVDTDGKTGKTHNHARFGFCAYPSEYGSTGLLTYIVNEDNSVLSRDTGGKPVLRRPANPERNGWSPERPVR